jgi:RimJ/RimL family protein N-acetyltransferase
MSSRLCAQGELARGRVSAEGIAASETDDEQVVLRDGSRVAIRPLASGDAIAIDTWFAGLGPETRYARFLAGVKWLDSRTRSELAQVDHRDHEAITAVAPDGTTIGIARYLRVPQPGRAEVAVAVADRWTGRGVASLLLRRIAVRARAADIHTFVALCLVSNDAILRLLSRLGPSTIGPASAGLVEVRIDLTGASQKASGARRRRA